MEISRPNIIESYAYYNIGGATANELRHQMDVLGPSDEFRIQHDAYTEWYIDWTYPNLVTSEGCSTGPVTVTVTITQTFPKWEIPPETPSSLKKQWVSYIKALQLHEKGHREIGVDAGVEILHTLTDLPSYFTCADLEEVADTTGENILDEFRRKELDYDRDTKHGELQGARFP